MTTGKFTQLYLINTLSHSLWHLKETEASLTVLVPPELFQTWQVIFAVRMIPQAATVKTSRCVLTPVVWHFNDWVCKYFYNLLIMLLNYAIIKFNKLMFHFTNICPISVLELGLCKGIRDVGLLGDSKLVASVNVSMNDSPIGSLFRLYLLIPWQLQVLLNPKLDKQLSRWMDSSSDFSEWLANKNCGWPLVFITYIYINIYI